MTILQNTTLFGLVINISPDLLHYEIDRVILVIHIPIAWNRKLKL